jgi:enamine deaminase RidA (YjgF/YER057c/UK114 family)
MKKHHIDQAPAFHRIVVYGPTAYLSGIVAEDGNAPFEAQVNQVLDRLASVLAKIEATLDDVLSVTVFLTDMRHKKTLNSVWRERFKLECLPARATVGVSDLDGPYLIEISAIAVSKIRDSDV